MAHWLGQQAGSDQGGERSTSVGLVLVLCASFLSGVRWSVTQLLLKDMAAAAPAAPAAAPPACASPPATREASGAACGGERAVLGEAVPKEADAPCAEEGGGSGGGRYSACRADVGETSPRGLGGGGGSSPAAAHGGGGGGGGAAGEHQEGARQGGGQEWGQGAGGQGGARQGGVHPLAMVLATSPFGLALLLPIALALELDQAQRWQPAPHINMLGFIGRACRGPHPHPHPTPSPEPWP